LLIIIGVRTKRKLHFFTKRKLDMPAEVRDGRIWFPESLQGIGRGKSDFWSACPAQAGINSISGELAFSGLVKPGPKPFRNTQKWNKKKEARE